MYLSTRYSSYHNLLLFVYDDTVVHLTDVENIYFVNKEQDINVKGQGTAATVKLFGRKKRIATSF